MDYKGIMEKPFFTLSVRTRGGSLLEQSQDTPPGVFSNGVMTSDQTLVLTTPISEFPQGQPCLFCDAMYGHKATGCHMLSCVVDAEDAAHHTIAELLQALFAQSPTLCCNFFVHLLSVHAGECKHFACW